MESEVTNLPWRVDVYSLVYMKNSYKVGWNGVVTMQCFL